jgi:hypothetical protein
MELRARTRPFARRAAFTVALSALLVPAVVGTATADAKKKKRAKPPAVTGISPAQLNVGDTLTIRGKHFRAGRKKNTVIFKRDRGRAVFVKADIGTRRLLKVEVPKRLETSMIVIDGQPTATRFRLRVLTSRLGRKFTNASRSPLVGPEVPPPPPGQAGPGGANAVPPGPPAADGDCDGDGLLNGIDGDDDNDLLADDVELLYHLNSCRSDTDGDTVTDGFEYRNALDLNDDEYEEENTFLPYPGKRPYPNPLDGEDANTDFDGDSLTLLEEFKLWRFTVAKGAPAALDRLTYTDGQQYSISKRLANGRRTPDLKAVNYQRQAEFTSWAMGNRYWDIVLPGESSKRPLVDFNRNGVIDGAGASRPECMARVCYLHTESHWLDLDGDAYLSDDERDEDADGLTNYAEAHGPLMSGDYWVGHYPREKPFRISYAGTDLADPDTDGDDVRDGADDQDHDDVPNLVEVSRNMATGRPFDNPKTAKDATVNAYGDPLALPEYGRVNPFNPCLPNPNSRTCPRYLPFGITWAPFDGTPYDPDGDDPNYLVRN